jgi:hypothetical protein
MSENQRILRETAAARERAVQLLESLKEAKARSEENLAELGHTDAIKRVTGRSAMENAIASAQRMVDALDRAAASLVQEIQDDIRVSN